MSLQAVGIARMPLALQAPERTSETCSAGANSLKDGIHDDLRQRNEQPVAPLPAVKYEPRDTSDTPDADDERDGNDGGMVMKDGHAMKRMAGLIMTIA